MTRWSSWLGLAFGGLALLMFGHVSDAKKGRKAPPKQAPGFVLPATTGGQMALGKPWKKPTVLVFFRGAW